MIKEYNGYMPDVSRALFIAQNAVITGNVILEEGVTIWYGAVLRGDSGRIHIGRNSNIQDNCILHCDQGGYVEIGENVLVGHGAIVHGCTVGDGAMIGMGSVVLNGASIGKESIVGAGALVTQNKVFPERSIITGSPAKATGKVTQSHLDMIKHGVEEYLDLGRQYSGSNIDEQPEQ